jgi:D-threo-aldose 1-dehydrogenase
MATTANWREKRALGNTGLDVTGICFGASPIGNMSRTYTYEVGEARAIDTLKALFASPINFIDTSNAYGPNGESEIRIGKAITGRGGLPDGFVLATKVDADRATGDFSGDRVRRSVEESFERLGIDHCQLMHLHDPEHVTNFEDAMKPGGPVEALVRLREEGVLRSIGVAMGRLDLQRWLVATGAFQVALNHNRFTLLDRAAEGLIEDCVKGGVAYLNAAPYGGGMLAKGPDRMPRYAYHDARPAVLEAARNMQRVCEAYGVPLAAAALQFSLRDPRVASTVVGMSEPQRIAETVELADFPIPEALWGELAPLTPAAEHWLS